MAKENILKLLYIKNMKTLKQLIRDLTPENALETRKKLLYILGEKDLKFYYQICQMFDLFSKNRSTEKCDMRSYIYYLLHTKEDLGVSSIGKFFNRNHATVINGLKQYYNFVGNKDFEKNISALKNCFEN